MAQTTGADQAASFQNLKFLTLTTGHSVACPRSGVRNEVIDALRPLVRAGGGTILGWDIRLSPHAVDGARTFELHRRGSHWATCFVAWTETGSHRTWQAARTHIGGSCAKIPHGAPTTLPWLAAALPFNEASAAFLRMDNVSELLNSMSEMADLEKCLAWTIIEDAAVSSSSGPEAKSDADMPTICRPLVLPHDGAHFGIGPEGLTLHAQMHDIMPSEVAALRKGKLEIGILSSGSSGIVLLRFQSSGPHQPIVLEAPFHISLLPAEQRHLSERPPGYFRNLLIVIQDSSGRQHGGRLVTLSHAVCETLERIVQRQAVAAADERWCRSQHDREIGEFYRRYPEVGRAADRLFRRAHVHETVH